MRKLDTIALIALVVLLFLEMKFLCKSLYIGEIGEKYRYASNVIFLLQAFLTGIWLVARES